MSCNQLKVLFHVDCSIFNLKQIRECCLYILFKIDLILQSVCNCTAYSMSVFEFKFTQKIPTFSELKETQKERREACRGTLLNLQVVKFTEASSPFTFRLPSDFDPIKYDLTIEISDSVLTSEYKSFTDDEEVYVRFCVQYNGLSFNLWVNQEYPNEITYKYITTDREKILSKILQHSHFGYDDITIQMGIHPTLDYDDENLAVGVSGCLEFDMIEVPFELFKVMISHHLKKAYPTVEEEIADKRRRNNPFIPSQYKSPEVNVIYL